MSIQLNLDYKALLAILFTATFSNVCVCESTLAGLIGNVDPGSKTFYFSGSTDPVPAPGGVFEWESVGYDNGNQEGFSANMITLGGTPNDDVADGPSFMEIDLANNAMITVLAFNFPVGGISGALVANSSVTFDYGAYPIAEQQLLESLAGSGVTLFSQDGTDDVVLQLIPEPATCTLALATALLAIRHIDRRMKQ